MFQLGKTIFDSRSLDVSLVSRTPPDLKVLKNIQQLRLLYFTHSLIRALILLCWNHAHMSVHHMGSSLKARIILMSQEPFILHGTQQALSTYLKNLSVSSKVGCGMKGWSQKEILMYGFPFPCAHVHWAKMTIKDITHRIQRNQSKRNTSSLKGMCVYVQVHTYV